MASAFDIVEWRKRQAASRFAAGLCGQCGKRPYVAGKKTCEACLARQRAWRAARHGAKRCSRCDQQPEPGYSCCTACLVQMAQIKADRVAVGLCGKCGKRPLASRAMCERCLGFGKGYRQRNEARGLCRKCGTRPVETPYTQCTPCLDIVRTNRNRLRDAALAAYGSRCTCCGETQTEFLCIDHVYNDGATHRRRIKGKNIARWLMEHDYPAGFQVLCWNCNTAKAFYGTCPHQRSGKEADLGDQDLPAETGGAGRTRE